MHIRTWRSLADERGVKAVFVPEEEVQEDCCTYAQGCEGKEEGEKDDGAEGRDWREEEDVSSNMPTKTS